MLTQYIKPLFSIPSYQELNETLLHIDFVDLHYEYEEVMVSAMDAYRFQGNLYGLLRQLNVRRDMLLYTMQLNGYNNPSNYEGVKTIFKIPVPPPINT